ncbi:uncharacterized protein PHACADRAFT_184865 [Phanerochaete carnosa HHB-10118-sp]|uniref:Uncharacterized protein n=1 Tax=Phanerochaete carnosa (strain HHB-10118-sp) TaxID=650164 RepID=K5X089_PHACS|nr:uncharacterized protein PHACADRAFT_184865 [Phanerochaete carnosa HHB-10118-sp]EKM56182.1 hypothetical protein PHACADRAFT_184865 [Phanerochaete carnosa HHB-10118-sp]
MSRVPVSLNMPLSFRPELILAKEIAQVLEGRPRRRGNQQQGAYEYGICARFWLLNVNTPFEARFTNLRKCPPNFYTLALEINQVIADVRAGQPMFKHPGWARLLVMDARLPHLPSGGPHFQSTWRMAHFVGDVQHSNNPNLSFSTISCPHRDSPAVMRWTWTEPEMPDRRTDPQASVLSPGRLLSSETSSNATVQEARLASVI